MTFSRHVVDLNVIIGGYLTIKNMISARCHCSCGNILEKSLAFNVAMKYCYDKKILKIYSDESIFSVFLQTIFKQFCIFILLH